MHFIRNINITQFGYHYIVDYKLIINLQRMIEKPFRHYVINDFLNAADYAQLVDVYSTLKFYQKQSDLFHFFQTNELADEPLINFFKQQLNKEFSKLMDLKDTSYNIFASYYFEGDYLLCHDDVIEDRKFAFSYYLQDHPSADLVFYDETATKQAKRIKVTKNILAIFQVSNISHHEVACSKQNGRKAVTGWINIKGLAKNRDVRITESFRPIIPKQILKYPLEQNLQEEQYYHFPQIQYSFDAQSASVAGPFYQRKATRLILENSVVFDLKGYQLFSADFIKFDLGDYVLLNDPINSLDESVLDVFIVKLPEGVEDSNDNLIQIIDENGSISGGIPAINDSVFIVHRNKKNYYIDRAQQSFFLGHLIYDKVKGKSKTKTVTNSCKQIKLLRQKLIKHIDEERQDKDKRQVPTACDKTKPIKRLTQKRGKQAKKKAGSRK